MIRGNYYEYLWEYPAPGTNHKYAIGYNNGVWNLWIDGVKKASGPIGGMTYGRTLASSERRDSGDTNYSHFWAMKKKSQDGTWSSWSSRYAYRASDPYYYIHWPGSSHNELYVKLP